MKTLKHIIDPELHLALQNNDFTAITVMFEHTTKPDTNITVLKWASECSSLECLDILLPHTNQKDRASLLEYAISLNKVQVVEMLIEHSLPQEQWNYALWRACSIQNQSMVEMLYPKANVPEVDAMFQDMEYTPDEGSYCMFLDQRQREQLHSKLTEETQHTGVLHSKSKI